MLHHRTKYSRFRNDSVTSLDEGTQSASLNVKAAVSSSRSSLSLGSQTEELSFGSQDSSTVLSPFIPKMANIKISNPASLLGLKNFSLGTNKEVPKMKLTNSTTAPTTPSSPETSLTSHLLACSHPRQEPEETCAVPKSEGEEMLRAAWEKSIGTNLGQGAPELAQESLHTGTSYYVRYMGYIEVLQSMRSLDFGTRTQVTREAITRVCKGIPGAKGAVRKRKPPCNGLSAVLGKSILQFAGVNIKLTISTSSLSLISADSQQVIAKHHMQSISFASGGDPDMTDYVAYVAKDPVNQRACHILECPAGLAQDVINTIGQAFELRFKQYFKNPPSMISSSNSKVTDLDSVTWNVQEDHGYYNEIPGKQPPPGGVLDMRVKGGMTHTHCAQHLDLVGGLQTINLYENCSKQQKEKLISLDNSQDGPPSVTTDALQTKATKKNDLFDDPCYINTQNLERKGYPALNAVSGEICGVMLQNTKSVETTLPTSNSHSSFVLQQIREQLKEEHWYHGKISRKEAESLLVNNGDFLVRESTTSPGQYVLTGLQGGQAKHILLVDPEGMVRTKDYIFDSVGHLIHYHMDNQLPIISSGSELRLKQSINQSRKHS
ncbi:SHC-transforming protein 4 isoform X1 [Latimeria chalumnae]|uniref:SHC-transforming protein 4 isoform X1 n=1 Tax=Latimeria chalumnae TaxID=7897 RepID=UPI0003C18558